MKKLSTLAGPFVRETTRHRWIFLHKGPIMQGSGVFLYVNLKTVEQIIELSVIWDAMALMWRFADELKCRYPITIYHLARL